MTEPYAVEYQVSWADVDLNGHMANSRYLDYATQTRFRYIAEHGFPPEAFRRHAIGPVIFEDRLRYLRELRFLERFRVTFAYRQKGDDRRKFHVSNTFLRDGETVAEITADAAWFDLRTRSLVEPPDALVAALSLQ